VFIYNAALSSLAALLECYSRVFGISESITKNILTTPACIKIVKYHGDNEFTDIREQNEENRSKIDTRSSVSLALR
jgi:hypothetical protein